MIEDDIAALARSGSDPFVQSGEGAGAIGAEAPAQRTAWVILIHRVGINTFAGARTMMAEFCRQRARQKMVDAIEQPELFRVFGQ